MGNIMIYRETGDSSGESYVEIIYGNLSSLSNLDVSKPTKVLIHGWLDTAFNNAESALRTGKRNYVQISRRIQSFNFHIRSLLILWNISEMKGLADWNGGRTTAHVIRSNDGRYRVSRSSCVQDTNIIKKNL